MTVTEMGGKMLFTSSQSTPDQSLSGLMVPRDRVQLVTNPHSPLSVCCETNVCAGEDALKRSLCIRLSVFL